MDIFDACTQVSFEDNAFTDHTMVEDDAHSQLAFERLCDKLETMNTEARRSATIKDIDVFTMYHGGEYTFADIATHYGVSAKSIMKRVQRASQELRKIVSGPMRDLDACYDYIDC